MIRAGSQLIFCSPDEIRRRTVVEQNNQKIITRIFSLDEGNVEPAQTLFFDGIISAEIVSVKQNAGAYISGLLMESIYLDFSVRLPSNVIKKTDKPLIIDFGTNSPEIINNLLPQFVPFLVEFSIVEIIAACTYYPSVALGCRAGLKESFCTGLILWEKVDLSEMSLLINTHIRKIS
jgi:hypothetical protein